MKAAGYSEVLIPLCHTAWHHVLEDNNLQLESKILRTLVYSNSPWSSGLSSWPQIQRSRVRFLALPDILSSNGSGMGSTQPCEDN
jgi:hypothetical protein